ncbi:MAG TPA: HlyD family efflux transporter periplasmic adaptor subunit [Sphingomicrobium sp.]|nr:HlyD family efflux transporter periplasmic adaptor subunit [Sphingomicrobium sp.]
MTNRRALIIVTLIAGALIAAALTRGFGLIANRKGSELTLHGNVDIRTVDLGFRVAGRINEVLAEEGQHVRRGDVLATLDTSSIAARIGEASAQVEQARAQLAKVQNGNRPQDVAQARARMEAAAASAANAEEDYRRRSVLVGPGAISRAVWEQTVAERNRAQAQLREAQQAFSLLEAGSRPEDIAVARAQLDAAKASQSSASTDLADTRLLASEDAIVDTRTKEPGAIVQPTETVVTLAIPRPLRIRAYVGEPDLSRVRPGLAVTVTADGTSKTYHGAISWIAPQAEFTPKSVETESLRTDLVYRLRITITDPDDQLRQGQPVTVHVLGTAQPTQ